MKGRWAAALAMLSLVVGGCGSQPIASPDPAALPLDYAIVWDIAGSTDEDGVGPYFDTPSSKHLAAGPVLVAWWCSGSGALVVAPGQVGHPPEMPSDESPLAFEVSCPSRGTPYVGWRQLAASATGGENALNIHPAASPSAAITYRLIFAQQAP